MELFQIKDLTFTYPEEEKPVLDSLNLSIYEGELVVLFGETGSGKSTLLNMLKRELTPHGTKKGDIYYKGTQLDKLDNRQAASEIGYVMQSPDGQIVTDKVWHELAFGLENLGVKQDEIRRRVGEIANFFGIHNWFHQKTTELSGGQKQLLNLASIMVMEPDVLILDEPTSQLDPVAATHFIDRLKKLNDDLGLTIIIVEHRLEEVLAIASHAALLEHGKVLHKEKPVDIGNRLMEISKRHPLLRAMPAAMQIYHGLDYRGGSPLTVKAGREFLNGHYHQDRQEQVAPPEPHITKESVIELKNTWFRYEKDLPDVLAGVNLQIHQGEIFTVLGGNASGKTTLLNVMAGQSKAYRGVVLMNGKNIKKYKGHELYSHNVAVLPQDPQTVFIKPTIRKDYEEMITVLKYGKQEGAQVIADITEKLAISHVLDKHPSDLSGGEQQKAALGKILLLHPKIILLDEPTKGIDASSKEILLTILKELQSQGLTLVVVTHDVEFAAQVSNRVGLYFDRAMISIAPPVDFFSSNRFYTTAASRMSRHLFKQTITATQVIDRCQRQEQPMSLK